MSGNAVSKTVNAARASETIVRCLSGVPPPQIPELVVLLPGDQALELGVHHLLRSHDRRNFCLSVHGTEEREPTGCGCSLNFEAPNGCETQNDPPARDERETPNIMAKMTKITLER